MPIKIERHCSRCRRAAHIHVASAAAVVAADELHANRLVKAAEITAYLKGIPQALLPDAIALTRGPEGTLQATVHESLCTSAEDTKRSCAKRVADLVKDIAQLEERKPRVNKKKEEAPAAA